MSYSQKEVVEVAVTYQTLKRGKRLRGIAQTTFCIKKLHEELGELLEAIIDPNIPRKEMELEFGDVGIMLMELADGFDFNLMECIAKKVPVLKERIKKKLKEKL